MMKNYFFLKLNSLCTFVFCTVMLLMANMSMGQVTFEKPSLTITTCGFPSSYQVLPNIVIDETSANDISIPNRNTSYSIILTAPTNFEFDNVTNLPTVSGNGGDITTLGGTISATTLTLTFESSDTNGSGRDNEDDIITISGLNIRAINTYSSGNITRTGGTSTISGLTNTITVTTNIQSVAGSSPSFTTHPSSGSQSVCLNASATNLTVAATGGAPLTYQWFSNTTASNSGGTNLGAANGAQTNTYTPQTTASGTLYYYCVVSGCAPSATSNVSGGITVNPLPTIVSVSGTSPSCNSTTLTASNGSSGTIYWQNTTSNGTSTATASTSQVVTASGTYYFRARSAAGCWGPQGSITVVINNAPTITTPPANASVAIGGTTSFTAVGSNSPDSYLWEVNTGSGWSTVTNGGVYSGATTGTLTITGATLAMNGYLYRASAVNGCGTSAASASATLTVSLVYCTPTTSATSYYISNVTFAGINNNSTTGSGTVVYQDFSATSGAVVAGNTYTFSATASGLSPNTFFVGVYFDWNNNGDFTDDAGPYTIGSFSTNSATVSNSITIPLTSFIGGVRMRVVNSFSIVAASCATSGNVHFEDYTVVVSSPPACTAPTTQPTALVLTPAGTTIAGSFTAATAPVPQSYLVVMNTTGTAPTSLITNGTTYLTGSSIGVGNTVVDTDTNTTFTAGGLNTSTTYYFFIYSMNNICTGGPLYNTNPTVLIGNATTTGTVPTHCIPSTTLGQNDNMYIDRVAFIGTLNDVNNAGNGFSNTTPGYQNFTGLASKCRQAQGEGVNMIVESEGGRAKLKCWIDWNKDGDFDDANEFIYGPNSAGISNTFGFVIPTGATPGDYRIRFRTYNSFYNDGNAANGNPDEYFGYNFDSCEAFNTGTYGAFTTTEYGEAEDYLFTVVQRTDANILTTTLGEVCGSGTTVLGATATPATTQFRWYAAATGGAQLAGSPTATGSWTTPSISATTTYYVSAWNAAFGESLVRRPVVARVNPLPTLTFTPAAPEVCGEDSILTLNASGDKQEFNLLNETFEGGSLGVFSNVNNDANGTSVDNATRWTNRASTHIPGGTSWKPAISTGLSPNSFALASSDSNPRPTFDVENSLTSGILDSTGYLNLTLSLKFYYSRYYPDGDNTTEEYVLLQLSTNGGTGWTTIQTFTVDIGIGTQFAELSIPINGYINQANLRFRVLHRSFGDATLGTTPDGVAVDDVRIYGDKALNTAFQWTGTSLPDAYTNIACTPAYAYVPGTPLATVYIKPTLAQLEMGTYTFTASAVLANGCTASTPITITNRSKVWKGTSSNDWNTASNWLPAVVPDATTCVVIPTGSTSQIINTPNALARNLTVKAPTGNLNLQSGQNLTVTDWIRVETGATFDVQNSANLIQVNNVANTGNINMYRNATVDFRDYVYYGAPVAGFSAANISTTSSNANIYKWTPTIAGNGTGNFGNWVSGNETMTAGLGYIERGLNSAPLGSPATFTSIFRGVPHNGSITVPISRGTYVSASTYPSPYSPTNAKQDDDNLNLLGNPYPSSISADAFLTANSTNLDGWIKLWRHGIDPSTSLPDPFYNNFVYNYDVNDYLTYNLSGGSVAGFDGYIGAGQGFFTKMKDTSPSTSSVATFTNAMRSNAGTPYRNDQFFRNGANHEEGRIWFSLQSGNNTLTTLLAYKNGATNSKDEMYDAQANLKSTMDIYSLNDGFERLTIQGRAVPFDTKDIVPFAVKLPTDGTYTIGINTVDGLFKNNSQNIYLEDKLLNIVHDLRANPYTFTATSGEVLERFAVKFEDVTLGNDDFDYENAVSVYATDKINIKSFKQSVAKVEVFDVTGKLLYINNQVNATDYMINELSKINNVLMVRILLDNNKVVVKKVVF
jgi:GEVED domain/Ig-like domain CHU_C associated